MATCPNCGCRVYALGCVNCNEADYIENQPEYRGDDYAEAPIERRSERIFERATEPTERKA